MGNARAFVGTIGYFGTFTVEIADKGRKTLYKKRGENKIINEKYKGNGKTREKKHIKNGGENFAEACFTSDLKRIILCGRRCGNGQT